MLRHENLWNDRAALLEKMYADGVYSKKLSNVDFCLTGLIERCRKIKKLTKNPSLPIQPLTDLVVTTDNFDELISKREIKDILVQSKHPVKRMDENSFTYYDYAVFKRRKHGKPPTHVIDEINTILSGGAIDYIY
jgi:hypothetical protein